MPLFKQALNQYKDYWKESLFIGLLSLLCVLAAPFIAVVGSFILSLILLCIQATVWFWLENKKWPRFKDLFPQIVVPLVICSIVMTPTSILIGSASGLLQGPSGILTSAPLALGILFLGLFFYFLVARALLMTLAGMHPIAQALDKAALESVRDLKKMTPLCLTFAVLFLISQLTWGALWIATLPLLYYATANSLTKKT